MGWNPAKDPGIGYAVGRFESKRRELFDDRRFENQKTRLRSEILQDGPASFADAIVRQVEFRHHELTATIVLDLKDRFRAKAKKVSRFKAWVWNKTDQAITAVITWAAPIGIATIGGILWFWLKEGR